MAAIGPGSETPGVHLPVAQRSLLGRDRWASCCFLSFLGSLCHALGSQAVEAGVAIAKMSAAASK